MKVSELEGALLDYWVARADGKDAHTLLERPCVWNGSVYYYYSPSTSWAEGGPIIEREGIELKRSIRHLNIARIGGFEPDLTMPGKTPLIAAMRAFVASKYGETVPCPDHE